MTIKDDYNALGKAEYPKMSIEELSNTLSTTIKQDRTTKLILFLNTLLNYTESDQQNAGFSGPPSSGKTYITEEVLEFFPEEDVEKKHYTSPQAFLYRQDSKLIRADGSELEPAHKFIYRGITEWIEKNPEPDRGKKTSWLEEQKIERARLKGEWAEIPKVRFIDLRGKIIAFLDQPHFLLLERLRPILSHDESSGIYESEIALKSSTGEVRSLKIRLRGHSTFIFLSTRLMADEQEQSRFWLLSTEVSESKLNESLRLLADRLKDKGQFAHLLKDNDERRLLKERVAAIKAAGISNIVIRDGDMEWLHDTFVQEMKRLTPRATRDFPRFVTLAKSFALFNLWHRDSQNRTEDDGSSSREIFVNREDLKQAYELYRPIAESNRLGIPPLLWDFWKKVLEPKLKEDTSVLYAEFRTLYHDLTGSYLSKQALSDMIQLLREVDLIDTKTDEEDKRRNIIILREKTATAKQTILGEAPDEPRLSLKARLRSLWQDCELEPTDILLKKDLEEIPDLKNVGEFLDECIESKLLEKVKQKLNQWRLTPSGVKALTDSARSESTSKKKRLSKKERRFLEEHSMGDGFSIADSDLNLIMKLNKKELVEEGEVGEWRLTDEGRELLKGR